MEENYKITGKESQMTPGLQVFVKEKQDGTRTKTVRVAAYCRVSTDKDVQKSSLENQIDSYKIIIKQHPGWKLAGIYADKGLTGTSAKYRQQFQKMMADVDNGKIDYIIAKSISRFARNTVDTLNYTRKLKEKGVGVYFEEQKIDTSNIASEMLLTIYAAFAQEESHSLSENMKKGVRSRFAMGIPKWSTTYGLRKEDRDVWVVEPSEAEVIKRIFAMCIQGVSMPSIAVTLESEGIPGPGKKQTWFPHSISTILHNEKYVGDVAMQKDYTVDLMLHKRKRNYDATIPRYYKSNHHEAIIDRESFEIVQTILEMNDKHKGSTQYPFYGFLKCPYCGENMVSVSLPSRMHHQGWTCAGKPSEKILRSERTSCPEFFVKDQYIHQGVIKAFEDLTDDKIASASEEFICNVRKYRTQGIKDKVEFIFLYELVDSITFFKNGDDIDWNRILVNWKCKVTTEGLVQYLKASEIPVTRDTAKLVDTVYYANGIPTNGQTNAYYAVQSYFDFCSGIRIYNAKQRDTVGSTASLESRIPVVLSPVTVKKGYKGDVEYEGPKNRRNEPSQTEKCSSLCKSKHAS